MEEHETVKWLLGEDGPLFDLLPIVRESLAIPTFGYRLKAVCREKNLVNFQWELQESGSQWSVVRYIDFLREKELSRREQIKQEILTYNRDDVRATRALELWLRNR